MAIGEGPPQLVAGITLAGTDHLERGREAQDAFFWSASADERSLVLAVADGAGSRDRSALGAHLAVDIACRVLGHNVPSLSSHAADWLDWSNSACGPIIDEFRRVSARMTDDGDPGPLAATLVAAVVAPPWLAVISLGDCFAVALSKEGPGSVENCHLVLPPQLREQGRTVFLTSVTARAEIRSFVLWDPGLTGVVLSSDGCVPLGLDHASAQGEDPAVAAALASPAFFCGLAAKMRQERGSARPLRDLLLRPEAERSYDDLTVLFALSEEA